MNLFPPLLNFSTRYDSGILRGYIVIKIIKINRFYWSHWIFHSRVLFERIHEKHHEFTSPFPLTGEYSSITEFIVGNVIPVSFGFFLL